MLVEKRLKILKRKIMIKKFSIINNVIYVPLDFKKKNKRKLVIKIFEDITENFPK
jgi:hypothetical protein